ncbi:hypothetical protein [Microbacterium flavum]|uniref:Uncharacterized protein n=1 Tax=Microbacterium flavum TaxID=415216 RepID=A0ABS5XVT7_9MICO|nr:hypothetical protein [Microbacterium flavum]MBT8798640.1 hypothetical protein [Microbacterium flavum]
MRIGQQLTRLRGADLGVDGDDRCGAGEAESADRGRRHPTREGFVFHEALESHGAHPPRLRNADTEIGKTNLSGEGAARTPRDQRVGAAETCARGVGGRGDRAGPATRRDHCHVPPLPSLHANAPLGSYRVASPACADLESRCYRSWYTPPTLNEKALIYRYRVRHCD